jgi:hypothetical protein
MYGKAHLQNIFRQVTNEATREISGLVVIIVDEALGERTVKSEKDVHKRGR